MRWRQCGGGVEKDAESGGGRANEELEILVDKSRRRKLDGESVGEGDGLEREIEVK